MTRVARRHAGARVVEIGVAVDAHAERDRDGSGDRWASNARLIPRSLSSRRAEGAMTTRAKERLLLCASGRCRLSQLSRIRRAAPAIVRSSTWTNVPGPARTSPSSRWRIEGRATEAGVSPRPTCTRTRKLMRATRARPGERVRGSLRFSRPDSRARRGRGRADRGGWTGRARDECDASDLRPRRSIR
jgi:hypothetical protein